ncbi:MAG: hypothetical protein OEL75_03310 [Kiritimatiellaceae bacterium]|nr:hypothetical protein [Kiritimatiellaceae bacterium]
MIALALLLILFITALILVAVKTKGVVKWIAVAMLILILITPIVLAVLVKPAQKGLICSTFGKISLLFSEPKDLWVPLVAEVIDPLKPTYEFNITHKYIGSHVVKIVFSDKEVDPWETKTDDLSLTITFYRDSEKILSKDSSFVGGFKGLRGSGLTYINYYLPEELPIDEQLKVIIEIKGNLEKFNNQYGSAEIQISKGSDL